MLNHDCAVYEVSVAAQGYVYFGLYFYSKPNRKMETFPSYWVCREPKP